MSSAEKNLLFITLVLPESFLGESGLSGFAEPIVKMLQERGYNVRAGADGHLIEIEE